jgi:hypothetical protein
LVGFARSVLAYEVPDGRLKLLDATSAATSTATWKWTWRSRT